MDFDEDEVTREPFEQEEEEEEFVGRDPSVHQQPRYDNRVQLDEDDQGGSRRSEESIEARDDNESVSSISSEDVKFAKSFDVQLRNSKSQAATLFNSQFINNGSQSGADQVTHPSRATSNEEATVAAAPATLPKKPLTQTSVSSDCIQHKGVFLQTGDIVGLCDQEDGQIYFAQLTGFVQDVYCEKSASVNWLVPTRPTSRDVFDPADYKIGLADTQLRKLDSMIFIRHCPSDYYLRNRLHQVNQRADLEVDLRAYRRHGQPFIWTTMKPCYAPKIEAACQH